MNETAKYSQEIEIPGKFVLFKMIKAEDLEIANITNDQWRSLSCFHNNFF